MAGRPQELINPYRMTIIIEASDRDKLIEKYGHYGISAAIRSVLPILIDYEIPDVIETVEFGSVAHL